MNREIIEQLLKESNIVDESAIKTLLDGIMDEHGKSVNDLNSKLATANTMITSLNSQIETRDIDLKTLESDAKGNEELQKKYEDLKSKYDNDKNALETELNEVRISSAMKLALNGKVHNVDTVSKLIDKSKLSYEKDALTGLEEQLAALRESDEYLFAGQEHKNEGKVEFPRYSMKTQNDVKNTLEPNTLAEALHHKFK